MQPNFADEQPVNPYDFWEGADFKIKIRKVDGWVNYDKSEFSPVSQLHGGDEAALEETYSKLYSLSEFNDPKFYKSYAELKAKLNKVLGISAGAEAVESIMDSAPAEAAPVMSTADAESFGSTETEDEDTLSYFNKLASAD